MSRYFYYAAAAATTAIGAWHYSDMLTNNYKTISNGYQMASSAITSGQQFLASSYKFANNGYKMAKSLVKFFAMSELDIADAVRVANYMNTDPKIKQITSVWVEMAEKGGIQPLLQNIKQEAVEKYAKSMGTAVSKINDIVDCSKKALDEHKGGSTQVIELTKCYSGEIANLDDGIALMNHILDGFDGI